MSEKIDVKTLSREQLEKIASIVLDTDKTSAILQGIYENMVVTG